MAIELRIIGEYQFYESKDLTKDLMDKKTKEIRSSFLIPVGVYKCKDDYQEILKEEYKNKGGK